MRVVVNPGTEPIEGADLTAAWELMGMFAAELVDLGVEIGSITRRPEEDDGGRFGFSIETWRNNKPIRHRIDMPGVLVAAEGEPWKSPRLYVDGSSWLWGYAVSTVKAHADGT